MIFSKIRAIFTIIQMAITVTITIILMYLFNKHNRVIRRAWGRLQMTLLGITLEIEGELDPNATMQIMNHQSVIDIIIFEYLHPKNIAWVAKKEIADLPWFGHILKAPDMIIIERESKSSLMKLIKDTKKRLDDNRPIAIFPEGTRSNGKKMRKFKAGAKLIAEKNNLIVQPVVIIGTRDILDSQKLLQKSGVVKIIYLPSVEAVRKTPWYEEIEENMRKVLEKEIRNERRCNLVGN
ncbi:MAG: 1-acyl-sn-glycerol-3-phosphate acyltransferase [Arcobacteraceae bacterium]|nr:1-acyl-sn-glycerol-3-phosphate acyltransferase [Arcobacteraceae bacterium]